MTKPQKTALELVRSLSAVRRDQLLSLMVEFGPPSLAQLDAMLRQLRFGGLLALDGEIVCASGADPPEAAHFEAIDVMLELTHGAVLACSKGQSPVLLRFLSGGEKSRLFYVVHGGSNLLALPLTLLPGQRAIVLLAENDPELRAALPSSHYVAVAGNDGPHRFYRCGGK